MSEYLLQYEALLAEAKASSVPLTQYMREELPYLWRAAYLEMTPRQTNILVFTHGTFDYVYDDYASLESSGVVEADEVSEARLVGAIGFSQPNAVKRAHDDGRLRGWVGPTGATFGSGWDKGHFIAHAIGGAVDGLEANVFLQLRSVNRGGYRQMEKYCAANPGVLCFSRPLYSDPSARPSQVEFGVLKPTGQWWVQVFENR
jgi:DNA/RNA non-specific endonuclease